MENNYGMCAKCAFNTKDRVCNSIGGKYPPYCSTLLYPEQVEASREEFEKDPELMRFAYNSSVQEAACYGTAPFESNAKMPLKSRILEIIEFAKKQNYHRLGLAFCIGLYQEALKLTTILESHGFELVSTVCKVGCTDKSFIGLEESETISKSGHESMCNPVAQALILNEAKTEFNLMLGLCVGHDSMFLKYAEAPTTVVAVKDRLLGHNPLAALYSNYYRYLIKKND